MAAAKPVAVAAPLPTRAEVAQLNRERLAVDGPSAVPLNPLTQEDLADWYIDKAQLEKIGKREMLMRLKVFKHFFPNPTEGANAAVMPDGYVVKATYPIRRKIDEALLQGLKALRVCDAVDQLTKMKIPFEQVPPETKLLEFLKISVDSLVKYDPDLKIREYRTLTAEQLAFFEQCMEIKPGSPQLDIEPPKDPK